MIIKFLFYFDMFILHVTGYLKCLIYFLCDFKMMSKVRKNVKLFEKKKSDICYVCALGPSLKDVELSKIEGDTIVVNRFHKMSDRYPGFVPTYYVLADAAFGDRCKNEMDEALEKYSKLGTNFIVNSKFHKLGLEKDWENIFYVSPFKGEFYGQEYRLDRVMPAFSNVVGVAIGTAMGMGYKKIILLGCDFNSFASPVSNHCYAEADNTRQIKLWYELYRYSIVAWGHEKLAKYARKHGIEIVNSTKGSLIDAYPQMIQEELYKR